MLLHDVADTSIQVASTSGRLAKIELLAACLRKAEPADVAIVVAYLSGELRQRRTGLGYAALRDLPEPADVPTLALREVDDEFATIAELSGKGSATARKERFATLMARATDAEQRLLAGLISGDLRQGAQGGVFTEAVAAAAAIPSADIRQAVMLAGQVASVAEAVLADGAAGLARFRLTVGSPVRPMLATPAATASEAFDRTGAPAACEWKFDGIRLQVHRDAATVTVFTRTLDDITARVPDVVEAIRALPVHSIIVDGEALALGPDARPLPFQRTASRIGRKLDVNQARTDTPLSLFLFDCLHLDGEDLIGAAAAAHEIPLNQTLLAFLTSAVQAQVSVAVRLVPIGQSEGLAIQAALETVIANEAQAAQHATLADIGGIAYDLFVAHQLA
jgi:DNA ligase-1